MLDMIGELCQSVSVWLTILTKMSQADSARSIILAQALKVNQEYTWAQHNVVMKYMI